MPRAPLRGTRVGAPPAAAPRLAVALLALATALALASGVPAAGDTITGRVPEVRSGDTFVVDAGGRAIEVRLADVDAPQGSDYYAPNARALLTSLVRDRDVSIQVTGRAADGGVFGRVHRGALDVNLEMVQRAAAYVCWDFPVETYFLPYENEARRLRRGLWVGTWEINARARCLKRPPVPERAPGP